MGGAVGVKLRQAERGRRSGSPPGLGAGSVDCPGPASFPMAAGCWWWMITPAANAVLGEQIPGLGLRSIEEAPDAPSPLAARRRDREVAHPATLVVLDPRMGGTDSLARAGSRDRRGLGAGRHSAGHAVIRGSTSVPAGAGRESRPGSSSRCAPRGCWTPVARRWATPGKGAERRGRLRSHGGRPPASRRRRSPFSWPRTTG